MRRSESVVVCDFRSVVLVVRRERGLGISAPEDEVEDETALFLLLLLSDDW